jgi:hypothetical protein
MRLIIALACVVDEHEPFSFRGNALAIRASRQASLESYRTLDIAPLQGKREQAASNRDGHTHGRYRHRLAFLFRVGGNAQPFRQDLVIQLEDVELAESTDQWVQPILIGPDSLTQNKTDCPNCGGSGKLFFGGLGTGSHLGPCPKCSTENCPCGRDHK